MPPLASNSSSAKKTRRRQFNLTCSDVQIARDFVGLRNDARDDAVYREDQALLVPRSSAPVAKTPSPDTFRFSFAARGNSETYTFPIPPERTPTPVPTATSFSSSRDVTSWWDSDDEDREESDATRSPCLRSTESCNIGRLPSQYSASSSSGSSGCSGSSYSSTFLEDNTDESEESDSEWYQTELGKGLALPMPRSPCSPSSPTLARKPRPDSIFIAPASTTSLPTSPISTTSRKRTTSTTRRPSAHTTARICTLSPKHLKHISHLVPSDALSPESPSFPSFPSSPVPSIPTVSTPKSSIPFPTNSTSLTSRALPPLVIPSSSCASSSRTLAKPTKSPHRLKRAGRVSRSFAPVVRPPPRSSVPADFDFSLEPESSETGCGVYNYETPRIFIGDEEDDDGILDNVILSALGSPEFDLEAASSSENCVSGPNRITNSNAVPRLSISSCSPTSLAADVFAELGRRRPRTNQGLSQILEESFSSSSSASPAPRASSTLPPSQSHLQVLDTDDLLKRESWASFYQSESGAPSPISPSFIQRPGHYSKKSPLSPRSPNRMSYTVTSSELTSRYHTDQEQPVPYWKTAPANYRRPLPPIPVSMYSHISDEAYAPTGLKCEDGQSPLKSRWSCSTVASPREPVPLEGPIASEMPGPSSSRFLPQSLFKGPKVLKRRGNGRLSKMISLEFTVGL